jgi:hypothetical protein
MKWTWLIICASFSQGFICISDLARGHFVSATFAFLVCNFWMAAACQELDSLPPPLPKS